MRIGLGLVFLAAWIWGGAPLRAEPVHYPPRPGPRELVHDGAGLLADEHATKIRALCTLVLDERQAPIVVVTIPSLATYGAGAWPIERFAGHLFDHWGIGRPDWNHGILLLVSKEDRKARIELGAEWGRGFDDRARRIMDEDVTPHFREGRFSEGILAGVDALAILAQGLDAPTPGAPPPPSDPSEPATDDTYRPWYASPIAWGLGLLGIATVVSLVRRGREGWGYKTWTVIFAILGVLLMVFGFLTRFRGRGGSSGGGSSGGSGGSFGGGSSGGGGATGSW